MQNVVNTINNIVHAILQFMKPDWAAISAICSVISLIGIIVLLKERSEKKRPYLQVSFELVKSSLVCLVIRNVGEAPAQLKSISFNPDFVKQLPAQAQKNASDRENLNISIHPKQQWVLCLDVITPTVLQYRNTRLEVSLSYTAKGKKRKRYNETEMIDFNDYSGFLVYISEIDELRGEVKNLTNAVNSVAKELRKITKQPPSQVQTERTPNLSDVQAKTLITGTSEQTILVRENNQASAPGGSQK